ncbi:MAG: hypothetical protein ACLRZZ_24660 [Enterocloster sp.]
MRLAQEEDLGCEGEGGIRPRTGWGGEWRPAAERGITKPWKTALNKIHGDPTAP